MSRTRSLRGLYALLAAGFIAGAFFSHDPASTDVIRVVANGSPQDEDYHGVRAFKRHVEEASNGEFTVEIFPNGQFCSSASECIDFMEVGLLDVFMTTGGGIGNTFGPGQIIDAPYSFANDSVAECVLDGPLKQRLREAVADAGIGIRLMEVGNTGGWRSFATTTEPVRRKDDLAGVKIRTTSAQMQQLFVRSFDAAPTPISWSELYVAMSTGVVDGTTNSLPDIVAANLHEQIKYFTVDNHAYMGAIWWLSTARWETLDEAQKSIVSDGFEQLKRVTRRVAHENEASARQAFVEAGGEIIELSADERQAFSEASDEIRAWFSARYGNEWFEALDDAIAECDAG